LEVIFINKKGFCTRVQECGVNLETARLKSLQKGQVLRPLIPIKYIHNKFRELDSYDIDVIKTALEFQTIKVI